jgi:DNA-binding CsgD family transcriptional regulator
MRERDRILIALRYFDELPFEQIADIMGVSGGATRTNTANAAARLRTHARNQFVDEPTEWNHTRGVRPWEPPQSVHDYIEMRHAKSLNEYLGIVTIAFREDISYLVDIIGTERTEVPGGHRVTLSPHQQQQADEMLSSGKTMRDVSRELGVSYGVVVYHARRRRSTLDSAA